MSDLPLLSRLYAQVGGPPMTNAEKQAAANAKAANNAKLQLVRNAEAWNKPRHNAAYAAAFKAKYGRNAYPMLNYTLGEHEYESFPPGVQNSNQLVAAYLASKKSRRSTRRSRKARRTRRR